MFVRFVVVIISPLECTFALAIKVVTTVVVVVVVARCVFIFVVYYGRVCAAGQVRR